MSSLLMTMRGRDVTLSRRFVDSDGVHWQVFELADQRTAAGAGTWLYFLSRGITRTLATYPDDWSAMDWPGLERLCRASTSLGLPFPDRPIGSLTAVEA